MVTAVLLFGATLGWFLTGYFVIASKRIDTVPEFFASAGVRAFGFALSVCCLVALAFVDQWWLAALAVVITPNIAAIASIAASPRA